MWEPFGISSHLKKLSLCGIMEQQLTIVALVPMICEIWTVLLLVLSMMAPCVILAIRYVSQYNDIS